MKTKAEIVQALLNEGKITAEDAVVLLTNNGKEKEYIFIPTAPAAPAWPWNPGTPIWYADTGQIMVNGDLPAAAPSNVYYAARN